MPKTKTATPTVFVHANRGAGRLSGRRLPLEGGGAAFVPDPLPPRIDWTPSLLRALSDADRAVGKLAGEGRHLSNPHLLLRPFLRREAVLSSRIEGTQATLGEILAVEAGTAVDRCADDIREVANYVAALEYGMKRLADVPLSMSLIADVHSVLMDGVRGDSATPGRFRQTQNWIGARGSNLADARYVPPPPREMHEALLALEAFVHQTELPPLVQIGLVHYQFEAIHPFLDGNGRAGRLLITLFLIVRDILPTPLLYLSAFFESKRQEYYDRLLAVTCESAWNAWLEYFLAGVTRQAEDAVHRAQKINELLGRWRLLTAASGSSVPASLVEMLAENPFCTTRGVAEKLGVAFTTAQRAIAKLETHEILVEVSGNRRDRVYCARSLLAILE